MKLNEIALISSAMPFCLSAFFLRRHFYIENKEYIVLCIVYVEFNYLHSTYTRGHPRQYHQKDYIGQLVPHILFAGSAGIGYGQGKIHQSAQNTVLGLKNF